MLEETNDVGMTKGITKGRSEMEWKEEGRSVCSEEWKDDRSGRRWKEAHRRGKKM